MTSRWIRDTTRLAIYARDQFRCVYCRDRPKYLELDHIDPQGGNEPENLVACCKPCNLAKGQNMPTPLDHSRALKATSLGIDRKVGRALAKIWGRGFPPCGVGRRITRRMRALVEETPEPWD